eukprot:7743572-Alexandrium_andersonii.AAC.1
MPALIATSNAASLTSSYVAAAGSACAQREPGMGWWKGDAHHALRSALAFVLEATAWPLQVPPARQGS